ncbi:ABC transporter ATP-binding protein [Bradyrhizobium sp. LHD-71]|uniref:ABC transporter ATP-binding protein n=1 Tax=Bradyrhizobium sp. LHD-71 TaxID=3072141 RepID=UPI00280C6DA7|nr:ABC transporter ATP-binding protein [Bradyrhizobium sp. LHD-71]MDQ8732114.1 ABC transporter ATP-binding protein [Bradyrhizobium sp. LHD-71]
MASVRLREIRKAFRDTQILHGVSLDIADGEFLTLVGPSGCGKSTLLRIIAGLEQHDDGDVLIGERPVDHLPPKARDVAMVFQSYALYPYMTVAENIALPLVMRRMNTWQRLPFIGRILPGTAERRRSIAAETDAVARILGISQLLERRPAQLSGGQRQRVALGRAMVRHPQAFLMDEPLSNLDAKLRVHARAEIADLHRRLGVTFIYVTHDQAEAMTMSDRVAVMMGGRLLQVAPPQEIYDQPATLDVARFVGTPEINVLPAHVRSDGAVEVGGRVWPVEVSAEAGTEVQVAIRPEALALGAAETRERTPPLAGSVCNIERLGSETLVHVAIDGLGAPLIVRVDPASIGSLSLQQAVVLTTVARAVSVFDAQGRRLERRRASQPVRLAELAHG